jgi:DNA-binding transcriptional ArsR family regulator
MALELHARFVYRKTMDVEYAESPVSGIAAAIAEPARTRMLYALLDGRARTSTELAIVAEVSPSTASVHLARLRERRLLKMHAQGKHHYYSLADAQVATALEALSVVAGQPRDRFEPNTPHRLRAARTCYDHMAGALAVALHDRLFALRWLKRERADDIDYGVTAAGTEALAGLGVDMEAARAARRRFACACLDWSERRPHLAGAIGAELLNVALRSRWVTRDLDSRALSMTSAGKREMRARFGVEV